MKKYEQLNVLQRYQIQALLQAGSSKGEIAKILEVQPSTIYRELERNTAKRGRTAGEYVATNAQRRAEGRNKSKPMEVLLTESMKTCIAGLLRKERWSSELISEWLPLQGEAYVSHETIYQWAWEMKKIK